MNLDVVERKLESLARCVRRVEARLPADASALSSDYDSQDIIILNLERAVQMLESAPALLVLSGGRPVSVLTRSDVLAYFQAVADVHAAPTAGGADG